MNKELYTEYLKKRNTLIEEKEAIVHEGLTFSELELKVNEKYKKALVEHRKSHKHTFYFPNTL
jgi:hypothetical protein